MEEERRAYLEGWDRWERRFGEAGAVRETFAWEKGEGELRSLERTAAFGDPDGLARFFADTDISVLLFPDPVEAELVVATAPSSRATGEERELFEERRERWARAAIDYMEEVGRLFAYLDARPERARFVFLALFTDAEPRMTDGEMAQLETLIEAFSAVFETAERQPGEALGLDELARLVYDPFPAPLEVVVDGRVSEVEGFVEGSDGGWQASAPRLEQALERLETAFVEPPLLTTYTRVTEFGEPFDAREFAARPRRVAELPTTDEVVERFEELLAPAEEYRLRWRVAPTG